MTPEEWDKLRKLIEGIRSETPAQASWLDWIDSLMGNQADLAERGGPGATLDEAMSYVSKLRQDAELQDTLGFKTYADLMNTGQEMQRKFGEVAKAAEQAQIKAVAGNLPPSDVAFLQNLSDLLDLNVKFPDTTISDAGGDVIDQAINTMSSWRQKDKDAIKEAIQKHMWRPEDFGVTSKEIDYTTNTILNSMPGLETNPIAKYRNTLDMEKWLKMNIPEVENLDRLFQTSGGPVVKNAAPKVGKVVAGISPFAKAAKPVLKALGATADIGFLSELLHGNSSIGYTQTNIGPVPVPQIPRSAKPVLETASRLGMLLGGGGTQGFGTAPAPVGGVPARGSGGGRAWME